MYAKSLHIYDFRCFGKAALELQYPGRPSGEDQQVSEIPNVNLILGDNGGGKSSILRAVAIAALAPALLDSGFVPYRLVRRPGASKSLLKLNAVVQAIDVKRKYNGKSDKLEDLELLARLETRDRRRSSGSLDRLHLESTPASPVMNLLHDDFSPAFFVVGYGATRRVETGEFSESSARKSRGLRYQRVAGLFEDHVALRPLQAWLPRVKDRRLRRDAIERLNAILPANIRFVGKFDEAESQYLFDFDGRSTPFSALSDGYKAFIGWAGDLVGHLCDVCPPSYSLDQIPGIVLVDEIDLHLHPEWQRNVVPTIAQAFPKLQFIFTSHSPLVASTVRRQNVFVTATAEDGTATLKQLEERVYGLSAEQLLLSSYFGLQTTRPESFEDESQSLFEEAAQGDSAAALRFLERLSGPLKGLEKRSASSRLAAKRATERGSKSAAVRASSRRGAGKTSSSA